jgi:hypothetical protein
MRAEATGAAKVTSPEMRPKAARQEEGEAAEEGKGLTEARPRLPQGREGAAKPAIKFRKVISRKKAGKQARTIIVTVQRKKRRWWT